MTSPIRPTSKRRKSYAELSAEIDDFLAQTDPDSTTPPAPVAPLAPPPRRSLLGGITKPKSRTFEAASTGVRDNFTESQARELEAEIAKRPMYSGDLGRTPQARRSNLPTYYDRKNEDALNNPAMDAATAFTRTAGGSTTQLAAGATRFFDEKAADQLAALSRDLGSYQPRTGAGRGAAFLGYGAPFLAAGFAAPTLGADFAVSAGMSALQAYGDPEQSTARAFSELSKGSKTFGRFSDPLRRISDNPLLNPAFEALFDLTAGAAGYGAQRTLGAVGRATLGSGPSLRSAIDQGIREGASEAYESVVPSLARKETPRTLRAAARGWSPAQLDLDAFSESTAGTAMFDDPQRAAQNELDAQRAEYDSAQQRAQQRRQEMAARGRAAGERRAQAEADAQAQAELAAAETAIPSLPRTTPTSADVDAEARKIEAWARRTYGPRDRVNAAVDSGDERALLAELEKLVGPQRPTAPTVDLRDRLDPQRATPQLDEVGQQLDEAGREALDLQQAEATMNPRVRAAREKLNAALDSGNDRTVQRTLRELAKLQDQGLYAAAPAGLALSQGEDGEGMDGGDAALLASLGLMVGKGKTFGERLYSRLGRAIDNAPFEKGTADQWIAALGKNVAKGEREYTGVEALLQQAKAEGRNLTRNEIKQAFQQNAVALDETMLGGGDIRQETYNDIKNIANDLRDEFDIRVMDAELDEDALQDVVEEFEARLPREILQQLGRGARREVSRLDSNNAEWGIATILDDMRRVEAGEPPRVKVGKYPKYEDYAVKNSQWIGPADNYREILLQKGGPDAGYPSPHWDAANVMTHVRMSDRNVEGVESLFVEEIQDDWAQAGRRGAYEDADTPQRVQVLQSEWQNALGDMRVIREEVGRLILAENPKNTPPKADTWEAKWRASRDLNSKVSDLMDAAKNGGEVPEGPLGDLARQYAGLDETARRLRDAIARESSKVPERPFKQTSEWAELGVKRALDEAVQKGYKQVVFAEGKQISDAVGAEMPAAVDALQWVPDRNRDFGSLVGWKNGEDVFDKRIAPDELAKLVGKEKADELLANPGEDYFADADGMEIGGGNVKFYNEVLPRVVKDYEKKLGMKLTTRRTKDGNLVIEVPDELRKKIGEEGQPLWAAGAVGAGAAASEDDGQHDSLLQAAAAAALVAGGMKWAQRYARPEQATKRATQWVRKNAKNGVPAVQQLATSYMQQAGVTATNLARVRQVDPIFAKRVADWYESVESDPTNPEVVAAYRAFADETRQQYDYLRSQGYTFEFVDDNPYNSSAEMLRDVAENKRLRVYKTTDEQAHQILSNEENDMFRAVHDFFGHAKEAHQFGPKGEENAYRVHSAMYSPEARRVMAAETRGQNSWVNFHDKASANRSKPGSVYAEQKAVLMPDEFMGDYPDMRPVDAITNVEFKSESQPGFTNAEFKEMTKIERTLGRAAFISKVVEPIIRSENLPASVAKGLGSWFAEGDYAITEAARVELSKLPKYVIERALARVSAAAKQAGYFFAVPNPDGEAVAVTLDFGKRLSEDQYKRVVEALSRDDGGATFQGTTMVRLAPGRMQTVLTEGADEAAATALVQRARELFPDLNVSGDVGRVDAIFRGGDTLDEALAQYAERIGVLGPGERRAQQQAARNYERIASGASRVRSVLGEVDTFLEGARAGGERGLAQVARGTSGAARPLAIGAALALTPSELEAQGTGVSVGEGLGATLGLTALAGAGGYGARRMMGKRSANAIARVASGAERMIAESDPLTNARPGNFTSNLQRVQRAAYSTPLQGPSQVDPNDWFRMDKASPDADRQRLAEVVETVVATSGVAVQKVDRQGNPVAGKPTITWDAVRDEARKLQVDPDRLIEAARQRGWTPAEALAGRTVISDNVNVIASLEQQLASKQLSVEEQKRLQQVLDQYEEQTGRLMEVYTTERSAAGRLLNSYKIIANQTLDPVVWASRAYKANGGALNAQQLAALNGFVAGKDRAGLAKFVADLHKPTPGELFGAFIKAGMLSSPKTHITNFVSNSLMTGMEMAKDAPASAADAMLRALVNAVDPDKAGARRTKDFNPKAMLQASLRGAKRGVEDAKKILRGEAVSSYGARWDRKGEAFVRTGNPKVDAAINTYLNVPFRLLSAGDRVFREAAIERSIAEQQRVLGTQAVTEDMGMQAIADAEFATFQQRTALGTGVQQFKSGVIGVAEKAGRAPGLAVSAAVETTVPFVKTPAAVLSASAEYAGGFAATGFNDLPRLLEEARKGLSDPNQAALVASLQKRAAERIGRQSVGALALLSGWVLAANGLLSAPIPLQKKRERDTNQMYGNTPGGSLDFGETTMSVDRISPIGNLLTAGAAMFEAMRDPENPFVTSVAKGIFGMGASMLDNSFLQGVQDVQRATTDDNGLDRLLENRALSVVPASALLRSVARVVDPTVRDAQTFDERLRAGLPFASRSVPAKRDPLGNVLTRPTGGMALLNEITPGSLGVDRSASNSQARLLRDVGAFITRPTRDKNRETVEEFRQRESLLGAATRSELDRLQRLPTWNQKSPDAKRDKIETRIGTVRSQATRRFRESKPTVPVEGLRPNVAGGGGGSRF